MKLFVIGATGGVGQAVVKQAIAQGHNVTAYVRDRNKVNHAPHANLTIVQGDGTDLYEITNALKGHDAVICTVGSKGLKASTIMSDITYNLVKAMQTNKVSRIVYCASAGIHREIPGIMGKLIMFLLRHPLKDHQKSYHVLEESGLDYTVVRPMGLVNEERIEPYRVVGHKISPPSSKISRAAVAHFMLQAVVSEEYIKQSMGLSY